MKFYRHPNFPCNYLTFKLENGEEEKLACDLEKGNIVIDKVVLHIHETRPLERVYIFKLEK